jgi:hypothetical protein
MPTRALLLCLLAALPGVSAELPVPYKLADTGITLRYTKTFGEDGDYAGNQPAFKDNGDGTITDRLTGLIWQKADGGEMTWEKAQAYAKALRLAGRQDWRLPTSMELFALANQGLHGPALDTTVFSRSEARYWWTQSPRADDGARVWLVNSGGGIGAHAKTETVSAGGERPVHVRCVAGLSVTGPGPALLDNADGTVTDRRTGLTWQQIGPAKPLTWEDALLYCASLKPSPRGTWRLPNIKELRSLSDDTKIHPSLDRACFPEAKTGNYWSSTTQVNRPSRAWHVEFDTGLVTYADKTETQYVLAVCGGTAAAGPRDKAAPDPKVLADSGKPGKDKVKKPKN